MHLTFEKISDVNLLKKAEFFETSDFARVHHIPRPDVPISKLWTLRPYFLPARHEETIKEIDNFEVRSDDVWIVTFPKSGTTWTQEMVWQICNDLDFEKGKSLELHKRSLFFERGTLYSFGSNTDAMERISNLPSPRIIKSHLPAPLLPKGIWTVRPRIIYVARNIKDSAVSFYYLYKNIYGYHNSHSNYIEAFLNDAVVYSPSDAHITDFWNMRHESNVLFLTYEEMKKDLFGLIQKTSKFLGKSYTKEQLKALEDHLSFEKMASNESVNYIKYMKHLGTISYSDRDIEFKFMRKGKIGSFREEMTSEMIEKFDAKIRKSHAENDSDPELLDIFLGKT